MRCPQCHTDHDLGDRFCESCGAQLGRVCAGCGQPLKPQARFCSHCGTAAADDPERRASDDAVLADAERRQLTVLFCDLVGSTEIASQLDPEDWGDIITQYQRDATAVIGQFGGHVAKYLGDGLLAFFGYPRAHQDEAERAVRAALGLLDAMTHLNERVAAAHSLQLAVRVGIHTGPVVVGSGGCDGTADVFGDTPNVAARVQSAAEPGTVLITAATQRLIAGLFIVQECGAERLKGVREPMVLYRVTEPSGIRGRLAAAAARGLTPFVGRDDERRVLRSRWELTQEGRGQVVVITGEAGIGKSRLVQTLRDDLGTEPHAWIECGGSPYFQNTPFHAVAEMFQTLVGGADEDPALRVDRLERTISVAGVTAAEAVPLLSALLAVPCPDGAVPLLLTPEGRRRKLVATLVAWLFGLARAQPVVLVVEDLQWVDPSTLELLALCGEQAARAPVLLLYTARPEFHVPWPVRSHHTHLTLSRLREPDVYEMIARVAARAAFSRDVLDAVVKRTDGVPLFIEELTKSVLETDGNGAGIPMTLQDSLMERLDRLGTAKEVAQMGAVLGREFPYALLRRLSPLGDAELQAALAQLAHAELLHPRGLPPDATYLFKHALVQETAYGSLLKARRRDLHRHVARLLTEQFPDIAAARPELLAQHYAEAGEVEPAVAAWQEAGDRARERWAFGEAAAHFRRGLELLKSLPDTRERAQQEFRLQLPLAELLSVVVGPGTPEGASPYERVRALASQANSGEWGMVLVGVWAQAYSRAELTTAREVAQQMVASAGRDGSDPFAVWAQLAYGVTLISCGEVHHSHACLQEAIRLYRPEDYRGHPFDPGLHANAMLALTTWHLGRPDQARAQIAEAIRMVRAAGHRYLLTSVHMIQCILSVHLRDAAGARSDADTAIALGTELESPMDVARARVFRGWAVARQGHHEEGIAELEQGISTALNGGARASMALFFTLLAEAHVQSGSRDRALGVVDDALGSGAVEEIDATDLQRLRAELLADAGDLAGAEAALRHTIDLARRQGSRAFELRALTSLARVLVAEGEPRSAYDLLAPVSATFGEGFDTRDLQEAGAMVRQLQYPSSQPHSCRESPPRSVPAFLFSSGSVRD